MGNIMSHFFFRAGLLWLLMQALAITVFAAPHEGDTFSLRQPDGTMVPVRVWGDEFHQYVENLEGFTLVRDSLTGWIHYAQQDAKGMDLIPSRTRVGRGESPRGKKRLRAHPAITQQRRRANQQALGYDELTQEGPWTPTAFGGNLNSEESPVLSEPRRVMGLTLLVDFPDSRTTFTRQDVDNFCNQVGYSANGNNGSIFDYFRDVSNGLLLYNNVVTAFVTLDSNKTYYDRGPGYGFVQEFINHALTKLQQQTNLDLSQLTQEGGRAVALNILYAGSASAGWANGLWPHQGTYRGTVAVQGVRFQRYQITAIGTGLRMGTFVHENGHMIMRWPDLYSYEDPAHTNGVGRFCIMNTTNATNPQQPNPYFRQLAGWIDFEEITGSPIGTLFTHETNGHSAFSFVRNANEFFVIEARRRTGRSGGIPADGLAIWHVHRNGVNTRDSVGFPLIALVQADGLSHLENRSNSGDVNDLFRSNLNARFNSATTPAARWHDGVNAGIDIAEISAVAPSMTFRIGPNAVIPTFILTVVGGQQSGSYAQAQQVQIIAPDSGASGSFLRWTSSTLNINDPYARTTTIVMGNANATVTANFQVPRNLPGTVEAEAFGFQQSATTATNSDGGVAGSHVRFATAGGNTEYVVNVQRSSSFRMRYRVATSGSGILRLRNARTGELLDSISIAGTGSNTTYRTLQGGSIILEAGKHVLRVESVGAAFNINWFSAEALYWLQVEQGEGSGWYTGGQMAEIRAPVQGNSGHFVRWSSNGIAPDSIYRAITLVRIPEDSLVVRANYGFSQDLPSTLTPETHGFASGVQWNNLGTVATLGAGSELEWVVHISTSGQYRIHWEASGNSASAVLQDMGAGRNLDTLNLAGSTSQILHLDSGRTIWRIFRNSGNLNLQSLIVEKVWRLTVTGGTGSGFYAAGELVPVTLQDSAHFLRWHSQNQILENPQNKQLLLEMPGNDLEISSLNRQPLQLPSRIQAESFHFHSRMALAASVQGQDNQALNMSVGGGSSHYSVASGRRSWIPEIRVRSLTGGQIILYTDGGWADTLRVTGGASWQNLAARTLPTNSEVTLLQVEVLQGDLELDWIEMRELLVPILAGGVSGNRTINSFGQNINFNLTEPAVLRLQIHNSRGILLDEWQSPVLSPGAHTLPWKLNNHLEPGIYWLRIAFGREVHLLQVVQLY